MYGIELLRLPDIFENRFFFFFFFAKKKFEAKLNISSLASFLKKYIKGAIHLNAIFPPLDTALMEISHSRFKQSKTPYHYPVNLCCGVFCEFLGDFWVYLGGVVFLEGLVELREIRNFED